MDVLKARPLIIELDKRQFDRGLDHDDVINKFIINLNIYNENKFVLKYIYKYF
jgi:hypothetical protein